jgi:hypothetical protein
MIARQPTIEAALAIKDQPCPRFDVRRPVPPHTHFSQSGFGKPQILRGLTRSHLDVYCICHFILSLSQRFLRELRVLDN